ILWGFFLWFVLSLLTLRLSMSAINQRFRMIPESTRCTVVMLNQKMKIKTEDVGKTSILSLLFTNYHIVVLSS
ncbi:MAG: hypothetical protein OEM04_10405, partial [Flavobacteriaceae bacterium]|nr:hypothetical protein [Flavobacteriaceae bacterium]